MSNENKQSVQEWVQEQRANFSEEQIIAKLVESGYTQNIIDLVMVPPPTRPVSTGPVLNHANLRTVDSPSTSTILDIGPKYADIYNPDKKNVLVLEDKVVKVAFEMTLPRVVVVDDFLSAEECDALIAVSEPSIARSTVIQRGTGGNTLDDVRTSAGMFHARGANSIVYTVERRISELIEWPVEHGEGMQVLRYLPDEKYEPHNDYFDPNDPGSVLNIGQAGQRIASVLIYLNDPIAGGSTSFPDVGVEVKPRRGSLLFFAYPTCDARSKTLHGGMPVMAGVKWVAVKWYRINKY